MKLHFRQKGFSLIEMLVYVSVLTIIIITIISILFTLTKSHRNAVALKQIQSNALFSMDRVSKEIHNAKSVDIIQSLFGVNPGKLVINSIDTNGDTRVVEFFLQEGVLKINENGIYSGQLTASSTFISNLVFRHIHEQKADAVKIEMQLTSGEGEFVRTENFYNTVILRDSY